MPAVRSSTWEIPTPWGMRDDCSGEIAEANLGRDWPRPPSNRVGDERLADGNDLGGIYI